MLKTRWRKVARDLWNNKSRTALVIASIAIGVFAFGGLFIARAMFTRDLTPQYQAIIPAEITFRLSAFDDELVTWLEGRPLVQAVQPKTTYSVDLALGAAVQTGTLIMYPDYDDIDVNIIRPEAGAYPPGLDEIFLERSFTEGLGASLGDTLTVKTLDGREHMLTVGGTVHDLRIQPGRVNPNAPVYVSQRTLYRMGLDDGYNEVELDINRDAGVALGVVAEDLREELERRGVVVRQMSINTDNTHWSYDITNGLSLVLVFAGLGSLLLSAFLVVNTISGIMTSQKRQIGVMKIIGASRPQIIAIYLVMVGVLGVLAFLIAFPLSVVSGIWLVDYFSTFLNYNTPAITVPVSVILMEAVVALLVPVLSALQPVLAGTRITAAKAISDYNASTNNNIVDRLLARLGGLPRPALISIRNTFRRKVRLLVTIFTLTLAGAFFISIVNVRSGLLTDIDELLALVNYDVQYILTQPAERTGLERRVRSFPGVAQVESWATTNVSYERDNRTQSETFTLVGLSPGSPFVEPPVVDGEWLSPYSLGSRYEIVVGNEVRASEPALDVGAEVTLWQGDKQETFRVVGVVDSDFENIYGHFDTVQSLRGTVGYSDQLVIRLAATVPPEAHADLSSALTNYLDDRDIEIANTTLNVDLVEGITGGFNVLVYLLLGMAVLIAFVAGLGLTGTMSLNVMERTREIGVMRAVGAGNNHIRLMFIGEGVLIGLLSTLFALPLSVPSTIMFANVLGDVIFGNPLTVIVVPLGVLIWFLIVMVVSSLASIAPANRASQISIREAIAYE